MAYKEEFDNKENPVELGGIVVTPQKTDIGKTTEQQKDSTEIPNEYGNTGRYNKTGRTTDQFYSDNFLK